MAHAPRISATRRSLPRALQFLCVTNDSAALSTTCPSPSLAPSIHVHIGARRLATCNAPPAPMHAVFAVRVTAGTYHDTVASRASLR